MTLKKVLPSVVLQGPSRSRSLLYTSLLRKVSLSVITAVALVPLLRIRSSLSLAPSKSLLIKEYTSRRAISRKLLSFYSSQLVLGSTWLFESRTRDHRIRLCETFSFAMEMYCNFPARRDKRWKASETWMKRRSKSTETLERLVAEYNLTADRIFTLDQCEVTIEKGFKESLKARRLLPRKKNRFELYDIRLDEWSYDAGVTMMTVVSAGGEIGPQCFFDVFWSRETSCATRK